MRSLADVTRTAVLMCALLAAPRVLAEPERLTMGVFPGVESGQTDSYLILNRFLPLAKYLSLKANAEVLVLPVKLPDAAMQRMVEGKSNFKLFFGPPVFASDAIKKADYVAIAVEEERIRGAFVVKASSKLQSVKDFSTATRIGMPSPTLLLTILANETLATQKAVVGPQARQYLGSAAGIVHALDNDLVEVAVIRDRGAQKLLADNPAKYRIVGQTVDAPGFALVAHKSVHESMRAKLRQAAVTLNGDASPIAAEARDSLKMSAFVAGRDDDFVALQRMMESSRTTP